MREERNAYTILVRKSEGKGNWEDQDVGDLLTLRWILYGVVWTGLIWLRIGIMNIRTPKVLGNYQVAKQVVGSGVVLSSVELHS
jgi:hypothetical protein